MAKRVRCPVVIAILILAAIVAAVLVTGLFVLWPGAGGKASSKTAQNGEIAPQQELASEPPARRYIARGEFIGLPEDYGMSPRGFHRLRLSTLRLGQPEPKVDPTNLPAFKYVTLDRSVEIDINRILVAGLDLYEAVLDQQIVTAAPFMIILRNVDAMGCPESFAGAQWVPALPVLPDVQSVKPPLVLKEQPAVNVQVEENQSINIFSVSWCKSLMAKTQNRFAGDVIMRMNGPIPSTDEQTDHSKLKADFIMTLE